MTEKVVVHRNHRDVAVELTQLHVKEHPGDETDISELYARYFSLCIYMDGQVPVDKYRNAIPEEVLEKFNPTKRTII